MSLIIALPCAGAVVICADSQETIGTKARAKVSKLNLHESPDKSRCLIFAGAGNDGTLIDQLSQNLRHWWLASSSPDAGAIHQELQAELRMFYKSVAQAVPAQRRVIHGVVCPYKEGASSLPPVFTVKSRDVAPLTGSFICGVDYGDDKPVLEKWYRPDMHQTDALLLGLYVFRRVKVRSTLVGLDTEAVTISPFVLTMATNLAQLAEPYLRELDHEIGDHAIAVLNSSISDAALKAQIDPAKWQRVQLIRERWREDRARAAGRYVQDTYLS